MVAFREHGRTMAGRGQGLDNRRKARCGPA